MVSLISNRPTPQRLQGMKRLKLAASTTIFSGAIVMRNATGFAVNGNTGLNLIGVGRAQRYADNQGSDGDEAIDVLDGIFLYQNSGATDLITIADIGKPAYVVDDQTVAKTDGAGTRSIAGFIEDVDPTGVWVRFDEVAARSYRP